MVAKKDLLTKGHSDNMDKDARLMQSVQQILDEVNRVNCSLSNASAAPTNKIAEVTQLDSASAIGTVPANTSTNDALTQALIEV